MEQKNKKTKEILKIFKELAEGWRKNAEECEKDEDLETAGMYYEFSEMLENVIKEAEKF